MFMQEDNTFNEIREKSIRQWLQEMSNHEDVAVRGGVKVTTDYLDDLKKKIAQLEEKNKLKDEYLRKLKNSRQRKRNVHVMNVHKQRRGTSIIYGGAL